MLIVDIISVTLLAVLLFWTVYNGSIIYVGVRSRRKHQPPTNEISEYPKVSIIVPTKNEENVIQRCLSSISKIDYPTEKMEIVVIDGNSTDGTRQICEEFAKKYSGAFKFISEGTCKGKPAALNYALPYTTGEIVAYFDADSVPEQDTFKKAIPYFADTKVMAVQGRTVSINERYNVLTRVISMEEKAWFQALLSGREKLRLFIPLNGSCQLIRRPVLEEMGGWDENSLTEDVEFALRMVEKNYLIKYAPEVCSSQETPTNFGSLVKQRVRWYRGYMETAIKYGRLLDNLNKRSVDAEISMAGPFMMVVSLLSYINWFVVSVFLSESNPILAFTGLVIALTACSLISIGFALMASEKPIKPKNLLWVPSIYVYWLVQMFIAGWAFLKLVFRRERVWTKTAKKGTLSNNPV